MKSADDTRTLSSNSLYTTKSNGVFTIVLNRPDKKNAIVRTMYMEWLEALHEAANDPEVKITMIIGVGDYFCSGNDLSNFSPPSLDISPEDWMNLSISVYTNFVKTFIDFPKPLIAALNGPAVGIAVTTLPLYDAVFAAEHVTLQTPFTKLGQTPEGCSSFTFPALMGVARASEILMFNKKITAQEAYERGLVTRILPRKSFEADVKEIVNGYAQLPPQTMVHSKNLLRSALREKLHEVNLIESKRLRERFSSEECMNAILTFFQKRQAKL